MTGVAAAPRTRATSGREDVRRGGPVSSLCLASHWGAPDEWIEMSHWVLAIVGVLVVAGVLFAGWNFVRGVLRELTHTEGDPLRGLRHANPRRNTPAQAAGPWDQAYMAEVHDDPSDDARCKDE